MVSFIRIYADGDGESHFEDTTGKGHISQVVGSEELQGLIVMLPD